MPIYLFRNLFPGAMKKQLVATKNKNIVLKMYNENKNYTVRQM